MVESFRCRATLAAAPDGVDWNAHADDKDGARRVRRRDSATQRDDAGARLEAHLVFLTANYANRLIWQRKRQLRSNTQQNVDSLSPFGATRQVAQPDGTGPDGRYTKN